MTTAALPRTSRVPICATGSDRTRRSTRPMTCIAPAGPTASKPVGRPPRHWAPLPVRVRYRIPCRAVTDDRGADCPHTDLIAASAASWDNGVSHDLHGNFAKTILAPTQIVNTALTFEAQPINRTRKNLTRDRYARVILSVYGEWALHRSRSMLGHLVVGRFASEPLASHTPSSEAGWVLRMFRALFRRK
jgi:hypothetical protein